MRNKLVKVYQHHIADTYLLKVTIKLADDCYNGQADFSITYDAKEKDPITNGYQWISGGCFCEDNEFLLQLPKEEQEKYLPFIRLHLSDQLGRPMYPIANSLYFLQSNNKKAFMENCRVSEQEYQDAKESVYDRITMYAWFKKNGLFERWKAEADKTIEFLSDGANDFEYEITREYDGISELEKEYEAIKEEVLASMNKEQVAKVLAEKEQKEYENTLWDRMNPHYKRVSDEKLEIRLLKEINKYLNSPSRKIKFINRSVLLKSFIFYSYDKNNLQIVFNWNDIFVACYQDLRLIIHWLSTSKFINDMGIHLSVTKVRPDSIEDTKEKKAYKWLEDNGFLTDKH